MTISLPIALKLQPPYLDSTFHDVLPSNIKEKVFLRFACHYHVSLQNISSNGRRGVYETGVDKTWRIRMLPDQQAAFSISCAVFYRYSTKLFGSIGHVQIQSALSDAQEQPRRFCSPE
jgi:hypothetical protein